MERVIDGRDFNPFGRRKGLRYLCLEKEVQPRVLRQFILVAQLDYGRRSLILFYAPAKNADPGTRPFDRRVEIEHAAILQRNVQHDCFSSLQLGAGGRVVCNKL